MQVAGPVRTPPPIQSVGAQANVAGVSSPNFLNQLSAGESLSESTLTPPDELKDAFRKFVGTTFYGQMLKSMRSTVDKPAYMHGGQTEEIFQQQMDQILVDDLTEKSADQIADPMFELFAMRRPA